MSFNSEAGRVAANFFLGELPPERCRYFVEMMAQRGEAAKTGRTPSGGGRVRNGFHGWSGWMDLALNSVATELESSPSTPPSSFPSTMEEIPTDPIEAMIQKEKLDKARIKAKTKVHPAVEPLPVLSDLKDDPEVVRAIEESKILRTSNKNLLNALCTKADELVNFMIAHGDSMGVSELRQAPIVIEHSGKLGVLVRSFTVVRHGSLYKGDFKANGKAVTRKNSEVIVQMDNQKLIRSNRGKPGWIEGLNEFFVKGMEYHEGAIYYGYLQVDSSDRSNLTVYYQLQNGKVVEVDVDRWLQVQNCLALGRDPAETVKSEAS